MQKDANMEFGLFCESLIEPPDLLFMADKGRWPIKSAGKDKYETLDIDSLDFLYIARHWVLMDSKS